MAENKKLGVYICSGCDIGSTIDCAKLSESVKSGEGDITFCKVNKWLCSEKAVEEIRSDILSENLEGIVLGACSPRFLTDVFTFDNTVMDRVSLREQAAWSHKPNDMHTQLLAEDLMKMGVAKASNAELPEANILDINDNILVIGGGIAGLNAALACAKAGYNVVLSEKEEKLGGFFTKWHKLTPRKEPYLSLEPNIIEELIAEVESTPKIKVLTQCKIEKTSGQPGMFDITANQNGSQLVFQVGAIIQSTGWKPYNPNKLGHLGYGKFKNVVTNIELEELAKNGGLKRPSDGKQVDSVVFVQCAGSRDEYHLSYCSSVCCNVSLKQALYFKEQNPDSKVYIIYKDMRTPAQYELFYKRVQNEDNIFITKGEITELSENSEGSILVDVKDTLLGEDIQISADLIVLATGLVPGTTIEDPEGNVGTEKLGAIVQSDVINLTYRQGPELPVLKYGFPDSHYICFPYETRRTGIYAAGTVRAPMDGVAAKSDAYGAALKAIQVIESIKLGKAVHPRSGDTTFPDFFLQRCTQCKRCTEECPFGTLDEDTKGTPKPNPNRCRRCGICMGACPERIISFKNYSVRIISSMIKSITVPTEEDEIGPVPRILAFMCENDAYPSLDIAARKKMLYSPYIRIIPVRCLGSVSISWIADSLAVGFDGVILFGCKFGDDYQCHFIRGSELANTRMENVQEKLKQLVLEPERVELHMLSIDEYDKIPGIMNKFAETIEAIGPNPYKEM